MDLDSSHPALAERSIDGCLAGKQIMATPQPTTQMDGLDHHLLLATSGQENILLQLEHADTSEVVTQRIKAFFTSTTIKRSVQVVPAGLAESADEADDILEHFFVEKEDVIEQSNDVPQVLVISYLEDYQRHLQVALKAVLREKRFDLKGQSYNLPDNFLLLGITADRERIPSFLVNTCFHRTWVIELNIS